ncbi:MAG: LysR substrate-binding domain-containing protein [Cohaesibacter sp.]|nr:LysR substrate-binding domain-containing protein [Cohaesibacter sp.]
MNDISWRFIRSFLLVADHGSFTAAANAANQSKANLSQQVSELEAALGVQLLIRTTRALRLTEIGQGYYEQCHKAMRQLDSAAEWASQTTEELKGIIRLNCVGGPIGEDLIGPLAIDFQKQHPQIQIHLDFSSPKVDLIERQYDLVVRMGDLPVSSLIASRLYQLTTRYVASPDFLQKYGPITDPMALKSLPLIYGSVAHWTLSNEQEQIIIPVQGGMKIVSGRLMRKAALAGLGVTRVAEIYIEADLAQGRLIEILPDWSQQTPLSLVCPPARHQLTRVRRLMTFLKKNFAKNYQNLMEEKSKV